MKDLMGPVGFLCWRSPQQTSKESSPLNVEASSFVRTKGLTTPPVRSGSGDMLDTMDSKSFFNLICMLYILLILPDFAVQS